MGFAPLQPLFPSLLFAGCFTRVVPSLGWEGESSTDAQHLNTITRSSCPTALPAVEPVRS